jgi:hypothetical protein
MTSRVLEWVLRTWAALLAVGAGLWVLGPHGAGFVSGSNLQDVPDVLVHGPLEGLLTGPVFGARLLDPDASRLTGQLSERLTAYDGGEVLGSHGDVVLGWRLQFTGLTEPQELVFVALHVVPLLVMAALWWRLAGVLRQSRSEDVFTPGNATLLRGAGLVVLLGSPVLTLATWIFRRWVVSTSQLADLASVPGLGVAWFAWPTIAAGLALLALGATWARGVRLQQDVEGLV